MPILIATETYLEQRRHWPANGRHILAQYDEESVIVYQAYRPSTGRWAAEHGQLGGPEFSYSRMSWVKPNFLWMMYRSGWGTKAGQETTLALRISREFFEALLAAAVESTFVAGHHESHAAWRAAIEGSEVRLQWDPDHDPHGRPEARRALQLGIRGAALRRLGQSDIKEVVDISSIVMTQRERLKAGVFDELQLPKERMYRPRSAELCSRLRLDLTGPE